MLCSEFEENNALVNCKADIGDVAIKLFANTNSYEQLYQCENNCQFSRKHILLTVNRDELVNLNEYIEKNVFARDITQLHSGNCNAAATLLSGKIGNENSIIYSYSWLLNLLTTKFF